MPDPVPPPDLEQLVPPSPPTRGLPSWAWTPLVVALVTLMTLAAARL